MELSDEGSVELLLQYDAAHDVAYLSAVDDIAVERHVQLDDLRGVDYAADGSVVGVELISPRTLGVDLDGLPFPNAIARVLNAVQFRTVVVNQDLVTDQKRWRKATTRGRSQPR